MFHFRIDIRIMYQLLIIICFNGCLTNDFNKIKSEKGMVLEKSNSTPTKETTINSISKPETLETTTNKKNIDCVEFPGNEKQLPIYLPQVGAVVTRFSKECKTETQKNGYMFDADWTSMGIPCTAPPGGEVVIRGHAYAPRLVAFNFAVNCNMNSTVGPDMDSKIKKHFSLHQNTKSLAHTPLAVQYWEIAEFAFGGTDHFVELRTNKLLEKSWPNLQKGQHLDVILYGQENNFYSRNIIYKVSGSIQLQKLNRFVFISKKLEILTETEVSELVSRCKKFADKDECAKLL